MSKHGNAHSVRHILIGLLAYCLATIGLSFSVWAEGIPSKKGSEANVVHAQLRVATVNTSTPTNVLFHRHTVKLVGMDKKVHRPVGGKGTTFFLPNQPGLDSFSNLAPSSYYVLSYDNGYLTGVGNIMVPYRADQSKVYWSFPVDARNPLELGLYVLEQAVNLSGMSEAAIYKNLGRIWRISVDPSSQERYYTDVAIKAGRYTRAHPSTSPRRAAKKLIRLIRTQPPATVAAKSSVHQVRARAEETYPPGAAPVLLREGAANTGKNGPMPALAITQGGKGVASALLVGSVSMIPGVGPILGVATKAILGWFSGNKSEATIEQIVKDLQVMQTEITALTKALVSLDKSFWSFVQTVNGELINLSSNAVYEQVHNVTVTYQAIMTQLCPGKGDTPLAFDICPALAPSQGYIGGGQGKSNLIAYLANNRTIRQSVEAQLTSNMSSIWASLGVFVPRTSGSEETQDPLFTYNNILLNNTYSITQKGSFPSIWDVFSSEYGAYMQAALYTAMAFDEYLLLLDLANTLQTYFPQDRFTSPAIPGDVSKYCLQTYFGGNTALTIPELRNCLTQEFLYSNAAPWMFMSQNNLTGVCPAAWQQAPLFQQVGTANTANCPWIAMPTNTSANNSPSNSPGWPWVGAGGPCTLNDWTAGSSNLQDSYGTRLPNTVSVTCTAPNGPVDSLFSYGGPPQPNGCAANSINTWNGQMFCDNSSPSNINNIFNIDFSNGVYTPDKGSSPTLYLSALDGISGGGITYGAVMLS